ncbi:ribosome maturation factor RimM [Halalkalibacterium ligniniphilum]|uniref:ribosome maturation factor RimM n=1 Tax=Halalkalibacterium ligniniphilum TaxID=1134413 RepID=UPI000361D715|nr:ribosome maturation factor RimM [Halalkalibacterium ligniniphilum]
MSKWFKVGKIVNTHGVRGEVRVISTTDFPEERYAVGTTLYLESPNQEKRPLVVSGHRQHKSFDLLRFEGLDSINEVEGFKGCLLMVPEEELQDLEEGEFYYYEIIGCTVQTDDGRELGKVKEILAPGANDVWVVQRKEGGKDILIPYIDEVVVDINVENKIITIHAIEGLLE